jgi:uncharacterized membrane protein
MLTRTASLNKLDGARGASARDRNLVPVVGGDASWRGSAESLAAHCRRRSRRDARQHRRADICAARQYERRMRFLYVGAVWLHILAAIVWIGGMTFLSLILVPALRSPELGASRAGLLHQTGVRFRRVGWISLSVLLGTGVLILALRGVGWADLASTACWGISFGRILAVKLLLVASVLVLSAVHDFWIGPRASRRLRADATAAGADGLRRSATVLGRVNLLLALAIVALAVMLVRGTPGSDHAAAWRRSRARRDLDRAALRDGLATPAYRGREPRAIRPQWVFAWALGGDALG